ncbi:MAG: PEP-CTERM sorting domain-containing protein [Pseudomonadota bacterium]|nr:PEP-CTERM sorting domain-containing protein [Pseudomonadota bacterium]
MTLMKSLRNAALAVMLLSAGVANAALYQFTLTGGYTASFQLDSNPSPDFVSPGEDFILWDIEGNFPGSFFDFADLTFYSAAIGGGMEILDYFGDTVLLSTDGPQIYTGSEDNPFFTPGTFFLTEFDGTGKYTLIVSAVGGTTPGDVPEPATGILLVAGFGAMVAFRKRKVTSRKDMALAA